MLIRVHRRRTLTYSLGICDRSLPVVRPYLPNVLGRCSHANHLFTLLHAVVHRRYTSSMSPNGVRGYLVPAASFAQDCENLRVGYGLGGRDRADTGVIQARPFDQLDLVLALEAS